MKSLGNGKWGVKCLRSGGCRVGWGVGGGCRVRWQAAGGGCKARSLRSGDRTTYRKNI